MSEELKINKKLFLKALSSVLEDVNEKEMEIGDITNAVGIVLNKIISDKNIDNKDIVNNAEHGIRHGLMIEIN